MDNNKNKFVDEALEKGFLNSILTNPETLDDVIDKVNTNDFYIELHKKVFDKIANLYYKEGQIYKTKVLQYINNNFDKNAIDDLFESDYILPMEIESIAQELNKYKLKRLIKNSLKKSYNYLIKDDLEIEEIKSKIQDEVFQSTSTSTNSNLIYDVEDVALESFERFVERQEGITKEKIRTGIKSLDVMLSGGLSKKHLSILAGRPSMGKTALALRLLGSVLEISDTRTLFISLEMPRVKLLDRLLIQKSKVASNDFYNTKKKDKPPVTEKQRNSIEIARNWIHDKSLKIVDKRGLSVEDIKSISRKTNKLFDDNLGFIIIDYLTEINIKTQGGRWDKGMADAIRELRNLAGELNCHVMLLHQLNRDFKNRGNKRPLLSDLRDTGEAEEKIDLGLLLHRPDYYTARKDGEDELVVQDNAELNIAKQREGKTGPIYFTWYSEILYFQDGVDYKKNGEINYLKQ